MSVPAVRESVQRPSVVRSEAETADFSEGPIISASKYRNLVDLHRRQAERLGARPALRWKSNGMWRDLSWQQYRADALACAAALADSGVQPGDRVGLLSENRVEWLVADVGILTAAAINVPPHAPLTAAQVLYQLEDSGTTWLFVSNAEQLEKIRKVRRSDLLQLRGVVVFDGAAAGDFALPWKAFLQKGREALPRFADELARREQDLGLDDLATIMYTSGTTGNPKGVMLSHGNLLSNSLSCQQAASRSLDSLLLSWLPYSHITARTVDHYLSILEGVTVCLAESVQTVLQDIAEVRPTHMTSVPRLYEKVLTAVASPDPEVTKRRLRAAFGPRMEWLGAGGAPLPRPVADAYAAAGLLLLEGYGLTESSPVMSFNRLDSCKLGTVGQAIPGVEIKIAPDGEVLTHGPSVMKGYWNNPQATAEALRDGWLYTGDLGRIDKDGFLSITGRKKEIMVLSNGKKVVPTFIEGLLVSDECIDQAAVYGEGRKFLSALIVPNWDNLRRHLPADVKMDGQSPEELAVNPALHGFYEHRVETALADVAPWEQIRKFILLPRPFTVDAEELTVSLKLRRKVIFEKYARHLAALYEE